MWDPQGVGVGKGYLHLWCDWDVWYPTFIHGSNKLGSVNKSWINCEFWLHFLLAGCMCLGSPLCCSRKPPYYPPPPHQKKFFGVWTHCRNTLMYLLADLHQAMGSTGCVSLFTCTLYAHVSLWLLVTGAFQLSYDCGCWYDCVVA